MTSPKIEKNIDLRETSIEKLPKEPKTERLPDVLELQQELDTKTEAGVEAGHDTLENLTSQEQASVEYPPEIKAQFAEIQQEAKSKLRRLDATLGRMKERFLSVANFLTGGMFEREKYKPKEKSKFFAGHYLDQSNQGISTKERDDLELQVNTELIQENARNAGEYLFDKIRDNDVVLLGEIHTHATTEKRAVAGFLEQAKQTGTTHIGLEIPAHYQEVVDRYITTGKFDDADDPADYERVDEYHKLFQEQIATGHHPEDTIVRQELNQATGKYEAVKPEGMKDKMFTFEQETRKNFLFKNHFDKDFKLLQAIRDSGLKPVCLDADATYGASQELDQGLEALGRGEMTLEQLKAKERELEQQRDNFMAQKIQEVVRGGGKMLAVLGNYHVESGAMEDRPNVADLLGQTDIKTSSINLDRDCDSDPEISFLRQETKSNTSSNSIMFSSIGKEPTLADRSIGFDLEPSMVGQNESTPYDGYIRLNGSL